MDSHLGLSPLKLVCRTGRTVFFLCISATASLSGLAQNLGRVAEEGQSFTVRGTQVVRYGAQDTWIEKEVTGRGECSNQFFGQDPLVGVKKWCELKGPERAGAPVVPKSQSRDTPAQAAAPAPALPDLQPPSQSNRSTPPRPALPAVAWGTPRKQARMFISGHSLTDDPYGEQVVAIANSLGDRNSARYNQQIAIGSRIRERTGMPANLGGYRIGKNRGGSDGLDVINELQTGRSIGGDRYDTLVITENHNLLEMMQWENTVRQLRHYHDRAIEGNPQARTYFHASWWDIDKSQPRAWTSAERTISLGWQCVGSRINRSLELGGRNDRILPLPMSLALVELVEHMLDGRLPELGTQGPRGQLDLIFKDNVHLTRLGTYYAALVTYAAVYEQSPVGAWSPSDVGKTQAQALQELAWRFVSRFYANYRQPGIDECLTTHMPRVCEAYWGLRGQAGAVANCRRLFDPGNPDNPLRFQEREDASAWFPARP
jgi:hypothetical protein